MAKLSINSRKPEIWNLHAFWVFLVIFSNFISIYMHKSFNPKTLLFAGRLFERFWKKHTVLWSATSSTPGSTHHLEVGRPRYERRKIQERRWDPQGTF